eukprot:471916_1
MYMYYHIILIIWILSYIQIISTSNRLLPEQLNYEISRYLSIKDNHKSVVPISRQTYRAVENDLQYFQQMKSIILNCNQTHNITSHELEQLSTLYKKLQFSEIFAYRRSEILKIIFDNFQPLINLFNHGMVISSVSKIYDALNMRTITIDEYKTLSFPNYFNETALKAKLLILSCRASSSLICASSLNVSDIIRVETITAQNGHIVKRFVHFPWLFDLKYTSTFYFLQLYFSTLYEYCFDTFAEDLHIPTLDAIFHHESNQKSKMVNLEYLMSNYGVRLGHKQRRMDSLYDALQHASNYNISLARLFLDLILKADMVTDLITNSGTFDGSDYRFRLKNDIMTAFVLHLGYLMKSYPDFEKNTYEDSLFIRQQTESMVLIMNDLCAYQNNGNLQKGIEIVGIVLELSAALNRQQASPQYTNYKCGLIVVIVSLSVIIVCACVIRKFACKPKTITI